MDGVELKFKVGDRVMVNGNWGSGQHEYDGEGYNGIGTVLQASPKHIYPYVVAVDGKPWSSYRGEGVLCEETELTLWVA